MKGQKEAVVEYIKSLGYTVPSKVAITGIDFSIITGKIVKDIQSSVVAYSKDKSDTYELTRYVRSMIKNHLNKAVELNGGIRKTSAGTVVKVQVQQNPIDRTQLTAELLKSLDEYVDGSKEV